MYSGELCDVLSSANTVMIIARRVRWVERLARSKQTSDAYTDLLENLNERDNLQNLSIDVRIILSDRMVVWVYAEFA